MSGLYEGHDKIPIISVIFLPSFGVKQIIDSLLFLFLLTYIGVNFLKKWLNTRDNHEHLD